MLKLCKDNVSLVLKSTSLCSLSLTLFVLSFERNLRLMNQKESNSNKSHLEKPLDVTKIASEPDEETDEKISNDLHLFQQGIDLNKLDSKARLIHQKHIEALQNMQDKYTDPETGYTVFTRLAHLKRGKCCGSACRHCPFGQIAAPEHKKKNCNTAFYY